MIKSARAAWEVVAGIIPGQPMPEYTRQWALTSDDWYDSDGRPSTKGIAEFTRLQAVAQEYARAITDPSRVNWVRIDWIWF